MPTLITIPNAVILMVNFIFAEFSGAPAIESPPSLTPTNKKSLIMENIENAYIWFKIKNVIPNYLFTTKKNYIDFNTTSDTTTLSQIFHLTFCTKVFSTLIYIRIHK